MIIYISRHGQPVLDDIPSGVDHEFPPGDYPLSPLGKYQAKLLGAFLKSEGFHGKVISSPYARTMETASIVAEVCGLSVFVEPRIQERRFYPEPSCPGLNLDELRKIFSNIDPIAELKYPWMVPGGVESVENVMFRVDSFLEELLANPPDSDILLMGHGATVSALMRNLADRAGFSGELGRGWNCAVGSFEADSDGTIRILKPLYVDFIPLDCITSNRIHRGDQA